MVQDAPREQAPRRVFLDGVVHDHLRFASLVLAVLLAFFALVDPFINPPPHHHRIALFDAAAALIFLCIHALFRTGLARPRHAHALGAGAAILVVANVLHDTVSLQDEVQSLYLILVLLACGALFLDLRWLGVVIATAFGAWGVVAWTQPGGAWLTLGMGLFAAAVLATISLTVRVRTYVGLESLRAEQESQTRTLEVREQALEQTLSALSESEERYRELVERAPDAFLVHADRRVLYVNQACVKLFGAKSQAELLAADALELLHPDYRDAVAQRHRAIVDENSHTQFMEMKVLRFDGQVLDVEALGQPIQFFGKLADQTIIRDITDRKRAERERLVAAQRLAEIDRLKQMDRVRTQFVNTISHELRTPLTPIKVQLHMLKSPELTRQAREHATIVLERNVQRLNSLVDELLEVARIQAGTLRISKTPVRLDDLVRQALESFVDVARQGGVALDDELDAELVVLGDPQRLTQVVYNLMGNALKFTPAGGRIRISLGRDGNQARVTIQDTGAGIRPEDLPRLFEPFSQVHDTMERTHSGTGLGLYICRGIVEGHEGRIQAHSDGLEKGSTFSFSVPIHETPP